MKHNLYGKRHRSLWERLFPRGPRWIKVDPPDTKRNPRSLARVLGLAKPPNVQ